MPDLLPSETWRRHLLEERAAAVFGGFGYREIRVPVLESTDLFRRSVGESTDIVEKEMYTLMDRDGDSITLRPEGTAGVVRACLQHGLIFNQTQRLWYAGPMFRHEKPQKGRYRQFEQIGAEAFGFAGAELDAELIQLCQLLFQALNVESAVTLQINSIGTPETRENYKAALLAYLAAHRKDLDPDSLRRLETNPLRILDSKDTQTQSILDKAPVLMDFIDGEAAKHFDLLQRILKSLDIPCSVNPRLVRGLDYYTYTVFEFVTDALGAQGAVCGGGRYDGLVKQLGGRSTPGAGFAIGVDRVCLLHEKLSGCEQETSLDLYCLVDDENEFGRMMKLCQIMRSENPGIRIGVQRASGKFKSQVKRAEQSGAAWLLTFDSEPTVPDAYTLRWLKKDRPPVQLSTEQLSKLVSELYTVDQ